MTSLAELGGRFGQDEQVGVFKITPKFAFAATGLILAAALIWVGFVEKHDPQGVAPGAVVAVLAYSGAVMVALITILLAYGRYRGIAPGDAVQQPGARIRRPVRQS